MAAEMEACEPPSDPLQRPEYTNAYTDRMKENVARGWVGDRGISYYRVTLTSFEGVRIRGWYMVPVGQAPAGGWPGLLTVPGYSEVMNPLGQTLVHFGYAVLALFPRGQGESRDEWQLPSDTKLTWRLLDRDGYYYRGAYLDCIRGLDFLTARPEVNAERVGMFGISQGGGFTLATAALDRRLRAAVAWIPFLCNYPVAMNVASAPYSELGEFVRRHPDQRAAALETLRWYDPLNLVDAITAPTLVSIGGADVVCPEPTVAPVFQGIRAPKTLMFLPGLEHGPSVEWTVETHRWLERYLR